ncbi:MAG: hypothetical protein EBU96_04205 [Actinobacteria bacterium]|nr:hypothetical protein [Actinomycetota bacterium]
MSIGSTATNGFQVNAAATFSAATSFSSTVAFSGSVTFTGNATFSSLTISNVGTSGTPLDGVYSKTLEVNLDGSLANAGTLRKVTITGSTITGGSISGLATDLAVADGGTGASSFVANGVLFGSGSSPIQSTAAGTTGQLLVVNASGIPTFASRSPVLTVTGDVTGTATFTDLGNATLNLSIPAGAITDADITGPLSESKIPTLTTAGKVSGSAITSGTIAGTTAVNSSGAVTAGAASFSGLSVRATNRTYTLPTNDGTAGQIISTNGAGVLTFVSGSGGSGLASVSADANPTLGGNLNVAGYSIISASNGNINITPNGTGTAVITKVATPSASTDAANKGYVDSSITTSAATAQYNASKIRGVNVSTTAPTVNGQVLAYNATTLQYEPTANAADGFWGFKLGGTNNTHLLVDYGSGNFLKKDYRDSMFGPFSSVAVNASGHLIATF